MNKTPRTPETMNATDRRDDWFENVMQSQDYNDWDFSGELLEALSNRFRVIEMILGKEETAPHLFAMLHGPDVEGDHWEKVFDSYAPSQTVEWMGSQLLSDASIFGHYGVTPTGIPFDARREWVDALAEKLNQFRLVANPEPQGVIARIINLALSRHAIDIGEGDVDLQSLSLFGGVTEGRIRNILSSNDSGLEKVGQRVTAASAATWLKGRKEFFASIWLQHDEVEPEAASNDFVDDVVFVPVAADGSFFHPGLARGGKFMIGAKGEEVSHPTFEEALGALQKMATPRWRRPNDAGNWGIVSGRDWKRVERRQLFSM